MAIFSSPTGFLEILAFLCAVAAFVVAVRFFVDSRKRLNEAFPGLIGTRRLFSMGFDRSGFLVPKRPATTFTTPAHTGPSFSTTSLPDKTKEELKELRVQMRQQQQELSQVLQELAGSKAKETTLFADHGAVAAEQKLHELQARLAAKEAEVLQLRHHEAYALKLQEQFDEVQLAFDEIQEKMLQMERYARQTAELNIQLEQTMQANRQMKAALHQKDENLQTLALENTRLREAFHQLETKLTTSDVHQQQLLRKAHLLDGLNTDFVQMAEAAHKLKAGMARAAELESLLQLMISRDQKES